MRGAFLGQAREMSAPASVGREHTLTESGSSLPRLRMTIFRAWPTVDCRARRSTKWVGAAMVDRRRRDEDAGGLHPPYGPGERERPGLERGAELSWRARNRLCQSSFV
jgi:hypothetical protein